jgi:hypothetical protein
MYHQHRALVSDGMVTEMQGGLAWRNQNLDIVCELVGPYSEYGVGPAGCPACTWTFAGDLSDLAWSGDACSSLHFPSWVDDYAAAQSTYEYAQTFGYSATAASAWGDLTGYNVIWQYWSGRPGWTPSYFNIPYYSTSYEWLQVPVHEAGVYEWISYDGYPTTYSIQPARPM